MEIKIIPSENIKPTSPTPNHLKIYKLSLLDQIIPPVFSPTILYFSPDSIPISQKIQLLKDSLASTLTLFYPFAGIIKDHLSVDCNDEGLPFSVATVKGQKLRDFLENPDMKLINSFLPNEFTWNEGAGPGSNVIKIQLNYFDCFGIAICVTFAHHIADATTICQFFKSWAANAQASCSSLTRPNYIAQSVFPQKVTLQKESYLFFPLQKFLKIGKFVTRRYVFDATAISTLQAQSTSSDDKQYPTRVEVISAFIWKCFMAAAEKSSKNQKPFLLTHPVNLRRRAEPRFSDDSFGNFLWVAAAQWTKPLETDLKNLVNEVKRALRGIDKEFVKRMEGENGYYENLEELRKGIPEEANWFAFSSWLKIDLYETDFGWGRPVWVSGFVSGESETVLPNSATLIETRSGDGIEAWVILDEKYVAAFENNKELRVFACVNPSVV
ncbi:Alcohol O-acetyltransferase [Handroanthus impetiginosus]|uniref:Alcohol O-acetyltransferase n=1 Tax=Handroanthus impetiginosus TaxID=429701 RepID=A0A2G9HC09_9LAMI|nr:Alcohol O-acetyltransferase [Handroanthus impetiginosus]